MFENSVTDPIQAAIEKAEEACPCRRAMSGLTASEFPASPCWRLRQKVCRCGTQEPSKPHIVCMWEGHAAIRSLAALVREHGHVMRCYCHVCSMMPGVTCVFAGLPEHEDPYHDSRCLPESREEKP